MNLGITRLSRTRTAALLGAALLAFGGCSTWQWQFLRTGQHDFVGLLTGSAGMALLIATAWLSAISLALFVESLTAGRHRGPNWLTTPAALRALVLLTTGAALSVGLAGPASADTSLPPGHTSGSFDGLTLPDRPQGRAPAPAPAARTHVVRSGDTLWAIAGQAAPGATNAELVVLVRAWHEANLPIIGSDPGRLLPGQVLLAPMEVVR